MKKSRRRPKLITVAIYHRCPYLQQDVALAKCYRASQDIHDEYCYGCDVVDWLKYEHGLRCYKRKAVPDDGLPETPQWLYVATDSDGLDWMVVNSVTGQRRTVQEHARTKLIEDPGMKSLVLDRLRPLQGAPGSRKNGIPEETRLDAAERAAKERRSYDYDVPMTKKRGTNGSES